MKIFINWNFVENHHINTHRLLKLNTSLCYELKLLGLDNRTTLVLSNTRELDRDLFTN